MASYAEQAVKDRVQEVFAAFIAAERDVADREAEHENDPSIASGVRLMCARLRLREASDACEAAIGARDAQGWIGA